VYGDSGDMLFAVTRGSRLGDTIVQIYRANDADHLKDILRAEFIGDEEDEDMAANMAGMFDDSFGYEISIQQIGEILL
jgi:hypothetical protein